MTSIGVSAAYDLFELNEEDFDCGIKKIINSYAGLSVTNPYKIRIMEFIDEISDEAKEIGAVNTVVKRGKKSVGYNTDYYGFCLMMKKYKIDVKDKHVYILGTGGTSRTVNVYMKNNSVRDIYFVSRTKYNEEKHIISYDMLNEVPKGSVLVNCTPKGMYPDISGCPVQNDVVKKFDAVVDLVYKPAETYLIKKAQEFGIKTCNGLYLLIAQAVKSEELWNNKEIDKNIIEEIYKKLNE